MIAADKLPGAWRDRVGASPHGGAVRDCADELELSLSFEQGKLDDVYNQRNNLAVALAHMALLAGFRAGRGEDSNGKAVVYVELPGGKQVSWHMAHPPVEDAQPWASLPNYQGTWDGSFLGREALWPLQVGWPAEPAETAEDQRRRPEEESDDNATNAHLMGYSQEGEHP